MGGQMPPADACSHWQSFVCHCPTVFAQQKAPGALVRQACPRAQPSSDTNLSGEGTVVFLWSALKMLLGSPNCLFLSVSLDSLQNCQAWEALSSTRLIQGCRLLGTGTLQEGVAELPRQVSVPNAPGCTVWIPGSLLSTWAGRPWMEPIWPGNAGRSCCPALPAGRCLLGNPFSLPVKISCFWLLACSRVLKGGSGGLKGASFAWEAFLGPVCPDLTLISGLDWERRWCNLRCFPLQFVLLTHGLLSCCLPVASGGPKLGPRDVGLVRWLLCLGGLFYFPFAPLSNGSCQISWARHDCRLETYPLDG